MCTGSWRSSWRIFSQTPSIFSSTSSHSGALSCWLWTGSEPCGSPWMVVSKSQACKETEQQELRLVASRTQAHLITASIYPQVPAGKSPEEGKGELWIHFQFHHFKRKSCPHSQFTVKGHKSLGELLAAKPLVELGLELPSGHGSVYSLPSRATSVSSLVRYFDGEWEWGLLNPSFPAQPRYINKSPVRTGFRHGKGPLMLSGWCSGCPSGSREKGLHPWWAMQPELPRSTSEKADEEARTGEDLEKLWRKRKLVQCLELP